MSVIERDIDNMKEELKQRFVTTAQINYGRELSDLSEHELYETLAQVVKQYTSENWIKTNKQYQENDEKQVYYFSIEFLLGRLLNTNLINLDLKNALKSCCRIWIWIFMTFMRKSQMQVWVMAAWAVWQPASLIPWLLWAWLLMAAVSAISMAF